MFRSGYSVSQIYIWHLSMQSESWFFIYFGWMFNYFLLNLLLLFMKPLKNENYFDKNFSNCCFHFWGTWKYFCYFLYFFILIWSFDSYKQPKVIRCFLISWPIKTWSRSLAETGLIYISLGWCQHTVINSELMKGGNLPATLWTAAKLGRAVCLLLFTVWVYFWSILMTIIMSLHTVVLYFSSCVGKMAWGPKSNTV